MIRVKRPIGSTPAVLRKGGIGRQELAANEILIKAGEKPKFDAYRDETVRDALHALFGRKCAFCESILLGTQSGDIEHYRPKGRVRVLTPGANKADTKDGYYWMAARWQNLLLACADCNRPRTQDDGNGKKRVMGKASFFPLANEANRATHFKQVRKENPLLIHPCIDEPAHHLEFNDLGGISARDSGNGPSAKGAATIEYCGLARVELLQMRARHRRMVMAAIRHIIDAMENKRDPGSDLDDLVQMLDPKEAYVAFTRHLVRKHLAPYLIALGLAI
jgi:uncharacterized protein (TIGR02646 family)